MQSSILIANVLALISGVIYIILAYNSTMHGTLYMDIASCAIAVVPGFILSALGAIVMNTRTIVIDIISIHHPGDKIITIAGGVVTITLILIFDRGVAILPASAGMICDIAALAGVDIIWYKILSTASAITWAIYDISICVWTGAATDIIAAMLSIIVIIRAYKAKSDIIL